MALNSSTCATSIKNAINGLSPAQKQDLQAVWNAIMGQLFAHIQANAQVTGPVTVTSVSGVTPGGGASGPGSGTLSGGVIS